MSQQQRELPRWLWVGVPVAILVSVPLARIVDADFHARWFNRKEGPIEWLTVAVLLVGIAAGVQALRRRRLLPDRRLAVWLLLHVLAAVYIAGEEISWGQTLFAWDSPELFERINGQDETNIHNTSSWFNEKPRMAFELWVIWAGIVLPLRRRRRPEEEGDAAAVRRAWIWPTAICLPTAIAAIVMRVPDRIEKWFGDFEHPVLADLRLSEPQELLFGYFLMLFLLSFHVRLRAQEAAQPAVCTAPRKQRSADAREPEGCLESTAYRRS
ncbi:MAG: hypothetical protein AAF682_06190 [Planctomycetota bacterium]